MIDINDVKKFNLRTFIEPDGRLTPIEFGSDIPFRAKRIFYVYGVEGQNDRGKHSHHKTKQVLICLYGQVDVICDDGINKRKITLSNPDEALYIPEMIWDEQVYKSEESVLLVLANTHYDIKDYVENYDDFLKTIP